MHDRGLANGLDRSTKCECGPEPGLCSQHGCIKTAHFKWLCRNRQGYYDRWESGHGPCLKQPITTSKSAHEEWPAPSTLAFPDSAPTGRRGHRGLGDTVAAVTDGLGFKKIKGCGCSERQIGLNTLVPYDAAVWKGRARRLFKPNGKK